MAVGVAIISRPSQPATENERRWHKRRRRNSVKLKQVDSTPEPVGFGRREVASRLAIDNDGDRFVTHLVMGN